MKNSLAHSSAYDVSSNRTGGMPKHAERFGFSLAMLAILWLGTPDTARAAEPVKIPMTADRWTAGTTRFIRVVDIDWIEGAGVYVNLHVGGKELLIRAALSELADRLDPMRFIRVHRSAIVNMDSIVELHAISHGEFDIVLKDGHRARQPNLSRADREAPGAVVVMEDRRALRFRHWTSEGDGMRSCCKEKSDGLPLPCLA